MQNQLDFCRAEKRKRFYVNSAYTNKCAKTTPLSPLRHTRTSFEVSKIQHVKTQHIVRPTWTQKNAREHPFFSPLSEHVAYRRCRRSFRHTSTHKNISSPLSTLQQHTHSATPPAHLYTAATHTIGLIAPLCYSHM